MLLKVKVNATVMVTTSFDLSDTLKNGQIGTAKYFGINQNEVETIYVAFDDIFPELKRINGNDVIARNNNWVPIKREETSVYISKCKITSLVIHRTQLPYMLFWACAVHKLSLNAGVISFDSERKRSFIQRQRYQQFTSNHVRDINNINNFETYNRNAFQISSNVTLKCKMLREISYFLPLCRVNVNSNCLTVSLLNTRSLRRHVQDIAKDEKFINRCIVFDKSSNLSRK